MDTLTIGFIIALAVLSICFISLLILMIFRKPAVIKVEELSEQQKAQYEADINFLRQDLGKILIEFEDYRNEFIYSQKQLDNKVKKSNTTQKSVLRGAEFELVAPFLADMPGHRKDLQFLGNPVDFICFEGKYEHEKIEKIWFIEIKTNNSCLTSRQKQIKQCIEEGKVEFLEVRAKNDIISIN